MRWKSNPLRTGSIHVLELGAIVLHAFGTIVSGLIEAELRPQGQEQTGKG
jgi:hypothetical protein